MKDKYDRGRAIVRRPLTEGYKLLLDMEIEIDGLRLPLQDIIEEEVRARTERAGLVAENIKKRKRATKRKLQRSAIELSGLNATNPR